MSITQLKKTAHFAALGSLMAISSPALADVDLDGTFLVGSSGPIVNVKACRWHTETLEWQADFGSGFVDVENVKCDGQNVIEWDGSVSNPGGSNDWRDQKVEQGTMQDHGQIRFIQKPVVQPLRRGPVRSSQTRQPR